MPIWKFGGQGVPGSTAQTGRSCATYCLPNICLSGYSEQERKSASESDRGDATCDRYRTARLEGPPIGGEVSSGRTPKVILVAKLQRNKV
jgi:hypothetical protein